MADGSRVEDRFDFRNPDYVAVFRARAERLAKIRANPALLEALKLHYKHNPDDFICDWGCTFEVRNPERGLPSLIPFILFPRQREWVKEVVACWRAGRPMITEKSRDCGISWLSIALGVSLCLFWDGLNIGYGSRKEEYVDKIGVPKALFERARQFLRYLPKEFTGDWSSAHMRIMFRSTSSTMTGEAGDNIGRGDRASIYFTDEEAFLERPALVEASLSQTTNCRQSISTPNGMANPFAQKRWGGKIKVFTFHWRAQPLDAGILTPSGWRQMGDMAPGNFVIGPDGRSRRIQGVTERSEKEVYRVEFSDGSETECCADHLWEVIPSGNQRAARRHIRKVLPLSEIMKDYVRIDSRGYRRHLYQVPMLAAPAQFVGASLPLDPYVLGCLLGDGTLPTNSTQPLRLSLGEPDAEIASLVEARLPEGCVVRHDGGLTYRIAAEDRFRDGTRGRRSPINAAIRALGLSGRQSHDKFIPKPYFVASPAERLDLLQGLMDTDGNVPKSDPGSGRFTTVSPALAEGVRRIAESLGGTAVIYEGPPAIRNFPGARSHECRIRYTVNVKLPGGLTPFKMARKADIYSPATRHPPHRSIVNIAPAGVKTVQCLSVEGGLYLTDHCIVTHNCDPRKDEAWYARQVEELDPVTLAQEVDLDYSASVEGVLIPSAWVQSAIDAHVKLGFEPTGESRAALDVADEGIDTNALAGGKGVLLSFVHEWSGKGADIFATTEKAFMFCDQEEVTEMDYDADGLGAGVRGDARVINERRRKPVNVRAFRGSGAVDRPEAMDVKGRQNQDFFANAKAQAWWNLRQRFERTHRAVQERAAGVPVTWNPDDLIAIDSRLPLLAKLQQELSQPTYSINGVGKIIVDKKPDGTKSPNLADSVMIRYSRSRRVMRISSEAVRRA